jgi:hypothetical protein
MMQIVRQEVTKSLQQRNQESSSSSLVPRPQWMRETESFLSDRDADRVCKEGTSRLLESYRSPSSPSPSSFIGGNTIKVTPEIKHPAKATRTIVNMAIDTQSDVTTALWEHLTDIRGIIPDHVAGLGGDSSFPEEGLLHVWSRSKGQKVSMPALVASQHQLPLDCIAFLGVPTMLKLEVAVEKHLRLPQFSVL